MTLDHWLLIWMDDSTGEGLTRGGGGGGGGGGVTS